MKTSENEDLVSLFWRSIPPMWIQTKAEMHKHAFQKYGITIGQYHMLRRIWRGMNSVSKLADSGFTTRAAASRQVEVLVKKGLISRKTNPDDRRNIILILTDEGEEMFAEIHAIGGDFLTEKFSRLDQDQIAIIRQAMEYFQVAFEKQSS